MEKIKQMMPATSILAADNIGIQALVAGEFNFSASAR